MVQNTKISLKPYLSIKSKVASKGHKIGLGTRQSIISLLIKLSATITTGILSSVGLSILLVIFIKYLIKILKIKINKLNFL